MNEKTEKIVILGVVIGWQLASLGTLIYLMFFKTDYNWWNWAFLIPLNFIISELWPFYWFFVWMEWVS